MLTYLKKFQKNPLILEFMISVWVRINEELTSLTVIIIQKLCLKSGQICLAQHPILNSQATERNFFLFYSVEDGQRTSKIEKLP